MYSSSSSEQLTSRAPAPDEKVAIGPSVGRAQIQVFAGSSGEVQARIDSGQCHVMAVVGFGAGATQALKGVPLSINVPLEPAAGSPDRELWFSHEKVQHGTSHGVAYARSNDAVVGVLSVKQGDETFEHTAQRAYAHLLNALDELGCPHLLRVWNFFAAINADEQGMERYQRFCVGRHRAFEHHYHNRMIERLPAASAIGTRDSDLIVYFIAAREIGQHLENPRQVSAYCYPRQYGPSSPTFSRATIKHWAKSPALYLSGTASVVGHESLHLDDVAAQTRETLANIRALFDAIPPAQRLPGGDSAAMLKIYVRDPAHADAVRAIVRDKVGERVPLVVLQGDICRRELLLEVEGVYGG